MSAVEPVAKTPLYWIAEQNWHLYEACKNEGVAESLMTILRGMQTYAFDHGTTIEYVNVARAFWNDGKLIVEFKISDDM